MSERVHDLIELTYGPVVPLLSKALRAQFVALPGKRFFGADFSNIEGRINAWFAGEEWKLQAFREYDAGRGPDLYKVMASRVTGQPVGDITKPQRQTLGKTPELACGYGGSIGAWLRFDPTPVTVARVIREQFEHTDPWRKAESQYDQARHHHGLPPDQWIAVKVVINGWREANSRIVQSWWALGDAAIEAVAAAGTVVPVLDGKVQYLSSDGFLWCRLPSGKLLAYAKPRLVETREDWLVDGEGESFPAEEFTADELAARIAAGATLETGRSRTQVQYEGKDPKTGLWGRQRLYGGLQCNNIVQSTARELLRFALLNIERARYPVVLHVHDEVVSEVAQAFGDLTEYESLMSTLPPWLEGLPLAVKAWTDTRYVK